MRLLLEHAATVDAPGSLIFDGPPGAIAAKRGHVECLQQLLSARAAPESTACAEASSCVHLAAAGGHVGCLRLLLAAHKATARVAERGAVRETIYEVGDLVSNCPDANGRLPLHAASAEGHAACLEVLIREGFSLLDEVDVEGDGAIHIAALASDEQAGAEMCRHIAEAGGDVNLKTACDDTALHLAAERGRVEICKVLLGSAADTNAVEAVTGRTPLHLAARIGDAGLCVQLLLARADAHALDSLQGTAWTCASSPRCRELLFGAVWEAERQCYEITGSGP